MKAFAKKTINRLATPIFRSRKVKGKDLFFLLGWIGRTLGLSKDVCYLHEPMNEHTSKIGNWDLYNQYLPSEADSLAHRKVYDLAVRGLGVRDLTAQS